MTACLVLAAAWGCSGGETSTGTEGGGGAGAASSQTTGGDTTGSGASSEGGGGSSNSGGTGTGGDSAGNAGGGTETGTGGSGTGGNGNSTGGSGSGAGGNGAGGSGGANNPGDAALCEKLCTGATCTGDTCVVGSVYSLSLMEGETLQPSGMVTYTTGIGRTSYTLGGPAWSVDVLAVSGPCTLFELSSIDLDLQSITSGSASVEGPTLGTVALPPPDPQSKFDFTSAPAENAFEPGEIVTFGSPGAGDVPAFSHSVVAPPALHLSTPDTLQAGAPLVITWDPPPPPDRLMIYLPQYRQIWCEPVDPSELVLPGSFTALFGSSAGPINITGHRISMVQQDVAATGLTILTSVVSASTWTLAYSP